MYRGFPLKKHQKGGGQVMGSIHLLPMSFSEKRNQVMGIPENIQLIQAPGVWEQGSYGQGVVVAVLDTGCQIDHPDLKDNIIGGQNFTSDDEGNPDVFLDYHSHGTHVAGIIAASLNGEGMYPGLYSEVVSVGAVDNNKKLASFSNTNEEIDLLAPGVDILSTCPSNAYRTLSGTSMAAPHVAGAAALILYAMEESLKRDVSEKELYEILSQQAIPLGYGRQGEGNGLLQLSFNKFL